MAPTLVFTPGRFRRWIASLARRAGCSVTEIMWRLEAFISRARIHDDCLELPQLTAGKRNASAHQENHRRCWFDRQLVKLLRLLYASQRELETVAGRRADALDDALRAVEDTIIGSVSESRTPAAAQPKEHAENPYANVGVYDPDNEYEPPEDDGEDSQSQRCFDFAEYLRFRRLPLYRRYHGVWCRKDKALVATLYRLFVIFDGDGADTLMRSYRRTRDAFRVRRKR